MTVYYSIVITATTVASAIGNAEEAKSESISILVVNTFVLSVESVCAHHSMELLLLLLHQPQLEPQRSSNRMDYEK